MSKLKLTIAELTSGTENYFFDMSTATVYTDEHCMTLAWPGERVQSALDPQGNMFRLSGFTLSDDAKSLVCDEPGVSTIKKVWS